MDLLRKGEHLSLVCYRCNTLLINSILYFFAVVYCMSVYSTPMEDNEYANFKIYNAIPEHGHGKRKYCTRKKNRSN